MSLIGFVAGAAGKAIAKGVAKGTALAVGSKVVEKVFDDERTLENDPYYDPDYEKATENHMHWDYEKAAKRGVPKLVESSSDHIDSSQIQHLPPYKEK